MCPCHSLSALNHHLILRESEKKNKSKQKRQTKVKKCQRIEKKTEEINITRAHIKYEIEASKTMTKESPCRFDSNAILFQQVFHHNEPRTIVIVMIMLLFSCALCSILTVAHLPTENKEKSFNHATQ